MENKRGFVGRFGAGLVSFMALAVGCAGGPDPEPMDGLEPPAEGVGEAEQEILVACPARTDCIDHCASYGLEWSGTCWDTPEGACKCLLVKPGPIGGV